MKLNSQNSQASYGSSNSSRKNKMPLQIRQKLASNSTQNKKNDQINQLSLNLNLYSLMDQIVSKQNCKLCQNVFYEAQLLRLCNCRHRFCQTCLNQYLIYKIDAGQQILCPQQQCFEKIDQNGQLFLSLSTNHLKKYKRQKLWRQTMKNPNTKICPQQSCNEGVVDLLLQPPQCRQCGTKYCAQCMMKFHSGPCDKNFQGKFRQWKRCPKCRLFINKDGGCNHIVCRCNYQFCFVCLSNWNDDHYQCLDFQELRGPLRDCITKIPLISMIVLIISFPVFLAVAILLGAIGSVIALILGMIGAPIILIRQKSWPIIVVFFLLPLIVVIGGIVIMVVAMVMIYLPFLGRIFSFYRRILISLWYNANDN